MNEITEHIYPTIGRNIEHYSCAVITGTDREEIIRCKDCRHFTPNDEFWVQVEGISILMATADSCDFWANTKCKVEPDGFCRWAERKESK